MVYMDLFNFCNTRNKRSIDKKNKFYKTFFFPLANTNWIYISNYFNCIDRVYSVEEKKCYNRIRSNKYLQLEFT